MKSSFRFHLLLLAATTMLASCGKDDTPPGPKPLAADSVTLNHKMLSLIVGEDSLLVATVHSAAATDKTVTWSSSDSTKATVVGGLVTAKVPGTVTITATGSAGKPATCIVEVSAAAIPVDSVTLSRKALIIAVGDDSTLVATVWPDDATDAEITWSSSDSLTAKVVDGKITALKPGPATITSSAGGKSASCTVTVEPATIAKGITGPLTWRLRVDSVLTISGEGSMPDYSYPDYAPWYSYRNTIKTVSFGNGVTRINNYAFDAHISLTGIITLPESVTSIGWYAFGSCSTLTGIDLPDGLERIEGASFFYCTNLTDIVLTADLTTIGAAAFQSSGLTRLSIPAGVTNIENQTFYNCAGLTELILHADIGDIGWLAFNGCSDLTKVTCMAATPPTLISDNFTAVSDDTLYVPAGSVDAYRDDPAWSAAFGTITEIPNP